MRDGPGERSDCELRTGKVVFVTLVLPGSVYRASRPRKDAVRAAGAFFSAREDAELYRALHMAD